MALDAPTGPAAASRPVHAYVGVGANLGDARGTVEHALRDLAALPSTRLLLASSLYRSVSTGAPGPDYVNAVGALETHLEPLALLEQLQRIEAAHGRERSTRNAPRTLDLDLLVYGDLTIATARLAVPHPRLHERAFVLGPLAEIASGLIVPGRGPVAGLLAAVAAQRIDKL